MKWVSASERLPPVGSSDVVCRTTLSNRVVLDFNEFWEGDLRGSVNDPEQVIEWLDESTPPERERDENGDWSVPDMHKFVQDLSKTDALRLTTLLSITPKP